MPKKCLNPDCNFPVFSHLYCKRHQYLRPKKELKAKPKSWIAPISKKHAEELKEYRVVRDEYMKEHPNCEANLPDCTKVATDLHHMRSRGRFLCDVRYFKALCRSCHQFVELHPLKALELGLSLPRFEKSE